MTKRFRGFGGRYVEMLQRIQNITCLLTILLVWWLIMQPKTDFGFQHKLSEKTYFEEKQAATFPRLKTHSNHGPPTYHNQTYPRRNYRPSLKNPCFWLGGPFQEGQCFSSCFEGFRISTFPMGFLWHERRWLARKHPWWCWSHVAQWGHPWRLFQEAFSSRFLCRITRIDNVCFKRLYVVIT